MLTDAQKVMRRAGIGGSEIAAVLGLSPYQTPLDVYLAKVEGWEPAVSPAMERGTFLEDGVAQWYAHRTGTNLVSVHTAAHPKHPVALCTPDRIVLGELGPDRLLSIKVPGPYVREQWGDGDEDVPQAYLLQVQWEFLVLDGARPARLLPEAHLAAPIDGDLRIYTLTSDTGLQGLMLEEAERFWRNHVVPRKPPPLDGSPSCAAWLSRRFPKSSAPLLDADMEAEMLAVELQEAELRKDAAEEAHGACVNRMKERIGEAQGIQGAFGRISWKADKNGKRSFRAKWRKA